MSKKYLLVILLPIILLTMASAILRFYKLENRLYWMVDEERDAFIVKKILVDKHPTLIGGALPGGFYLAPGYFYISAFFYFFTNGNPLGLGFVAAFFGSAATIIIFYVAKKLFDSTTAILAAIFYTFSYLAVIYNRAWWPLTFSPIISLVSYYLIFLIIKTKSLKLAIPLSLLMVVAVQTDPSNFAALILIVILWIFAKLPIKSKYTISAIAILIFSHIPLLIFDIRHDFLNAKALVAFFTGKTGAGINFDLETFKETLLLVPRSFVRFFWIFGNKDVAVQIAPTPRYIAEKYAAIPLPVLFAGIVVLIAFFASFLKDKRNLAMLIISLHLAVAISGIALQNFFFGSWNFEWTVQVLFPAYAITAAVIFKKVIFTKWLKIPAFTLMLAFVIFATKVIITSPNSYNFLDKSQAVKFAIERVNGQQFLLDSIGQNFSWGGYRYLFYLYGHQPAKSYMDPLFAGWLYPKQNLETDPEIAVVIVNPDFHHDDDFNLRYQTYLSQTMDKKIFGRIEVLIVNNEDQWIKL